MATNSSSRPTPSSSRVCARAKRYLRTQPPSAARGISFHRICQASVLGHTFCSRTEDAMKANFRVLHVAAAIALGLAGPAFAADNVIKIGALLPISGPGSYFGVQDKQGIELAIEQINK